FRFAPKKPRSAMGFTNSRGKRPSRLHSSMIGIRFSSMKRRAVSRTSRSSSFSRESSSMKSTPLNLKGGINYLFQKDESCVSHQRQSRRSRAEQRRLQETFKANRGTGMGQTLLRLQRLQRQRWRLRRRMPLRSPTSGGTG